MEQFDTLAKIDSRHLDTRSTQGQEQETTYYFRIDVEAGSIREDMQDEDYNNL
jgi:hypothetical protein